MNTESKILLKKNILNFLTYSVQDHSDVNQKPTPSPELNNTSKQMFDLLKILNINI